MKTYTTVVLGYSLLGAIGLSLAIPPGYASPVFPAAGFALAAILHYGNRLLPAIWLGSFLLNIGVAVSHQNFSAGTLLAAGGIASGATLQAWLGAWLIRRNSEGDDLNLESLPQIVMFLILGGGVACVISATIGPSILLASHIVNESNFGFAWWNWYIGDLLGVTTFSILVLGLLQDRDDYWRKRLRNMVVPIVALIFLAAGLFLSSAHWEALRERAEMESHGELITKALQTHLDQTHEMLGLLSHFLEPSAEVSFREFRHITDQILNKHPEISAFSFNNLVTGADRPRYERATAERLGMANFQITERQNGTLTRARQRPSYVAVSMINPLEGNQAALGFDIQSEPKRRDAIERAIASRSLSATAPLKLVQDQREHTGILMLHPSFQFIPASSSSEAQERIVGFAVAVLKLDVLFQAVALPLLPAGMIVEISDIQTTEEGKPLYRSVPPSQLASSDITPWESRLQLADRQFKLTLKADEFYVTTHRPWIAWAVGAIAMLFVSVCQILLLVITGRASQIQRQVDAQTIELSTQNEALRDSERRFRLMTETIHDYSIIFLDKDGKVSTWNRGAQRISGYQRDEIIGQPISVFYLQNDVITGVPEQLLARAREFGSVNSRSWRSGKNGRQFFADVIITAIVNESGELIGYAKITRDITERKRLEDELQQHQENLELLVQERTADLEVAKEAAEAASRAKTAFLSMASHELRTPMNGIMGTIALARRRTEDPKLLDYLNKADRSAQHLLTIINDVLDISRIEADKLTLAYLPFTADEITRHVQDNLEDLASGKGIALRFEKGPTIDDYQFMGDPTRITQVLMNLVGNALKFTHQGSVNTTISLRPQPDGQQLLKFSVTDTGIGIRAEDQARIFNPFEQADNTMTRKYGGTGLGLALCQRLVHAMGGQIGLISCEGQGSTFWFEIPVPDSVFSLHATQQNGTVDCLQQLSDAHGGARILVAEDEPINQEIIANLLEEAGLEVFVANDGIEAVDAAKAIVFDLILMDMNMPNLGGDQATAQIRELPGYQDTPIIALTANAFIEDRDACIRAGMNDHIGKPVPPETLFKTLLRWLDRKRQN